MTKQVTLLTIINDGEDLTEEMKDSLYALVATGCHRTTKERLRRKIYNISPACWSSYGIFGRVHLEQDGRFTYCAGQDYTVEIRTVRQCLL